MEALDLGHLCCSPFLSLGDVPASTNMFNHRKLASLKALRSCVLSTGEHDGIKILSWDSYLLKVIYFI